MDPVTLCIVAGVSQVCWEASSIPNLRTSTFPIDLFTLYLHYLYIRYTYLINEDKYSIRLRELFSIFLDVGSFGKVDHASANSTTFHWYLYFLYLFIYFYFRLYIARGTEHLYYLVIFPR